MIILHGGCTSATLHLGTQEGKLKSVLGYRVHVFTYKAPKAEENGVRWTEKCASA